MEEKDGKFPLEGAPNLFFLRKTTRLRLASEGIRRGQQREQRLSFDRRNQTEISLPLLPLV